MPRLPGRPSTAADPSLVWTPARQAENLAAARKSAPKRKPKPCTACREKPKQQGHPLWCAECLLRRQPMEVQAAAAARRLARVPEAEWRFDVPEAEWPEGRRWCAGCQTMRSLRDFGDRATRCKPCATTANHRTRIERVYGLPRDQYEAILKLQDGRCAICRRRFVSKRPNVDHDHTSGAVRGLLCDRCNNELLGAAASAGDASTGGALKILLRAVYYLRYPPAQGSWLPGVAEEPPPFRSSGWVWRSQPRQTAAAAYRVVACSSRVGSEGVRRTLATVQPVDGLGPLGGTAAVRDLPGGEGVGRAGDPTGDLLVLRHTDILPRCLPFRQAVDARPAWHCGREVRRSQLATCVASADQRSGRWRRRCGTKTRPMAGPGIGCDIRAPLEAPHVVADPAGRAVHRVDPLANLLFQVGGDVGQARRGGPDAAGLATPLDHPHGFRHNHILPRLCLFVKAGSAGHASSLPR